MCVRANSGSDQRAEYRLEKGPYLFMANTFDFATKQFSVTQTKRGISNYKENKVYKIETLWIIKYFTFPGSLTLYFSHTCCHTEHVNAFVFSVMNSSIKKNAILKWSKR